MDEYLKQVANHFDFEGELTDITNVSIGLINDSFIVTYVSSGKRVRYLLQKINNYVFKKPVEVMSNIVSVTEYLNEKNKNSGLFDPEKSIFVIPSKDGKPYYLSEKGEFFRAYNYIENTYSIDCVSQAKDAFNAGKAFGGFIYSLKDTDPESLFVTIPDFHNTIKRYANLLDAIKNDSFGRVKEVAKEIELIDKIKDGVFVITEKYESGEIPCRVIHNDTKINNVLFDKDTHDVVCVVDLDTIMPGSFLHDFGDAITTGAVREENGKLVLELDYYEHYVRGYLSSCINMLTRNEIELMPLAAKTLAFEVMTRFLADYLSGDVYFKTTYEGQNLDRTRQEISLVVDMIGKTDKMKEITKRCFEELSNA